MTWTTRDMKFVGGPSRKNEAENLYGYCGGNPIGRTDPKGIYWLYALSLKDWIWIDEIGQPKPEYFPKPDNKYTEEIKKKLEFETITNKVL
jgi:hypothetical protein